jgi:hypothetical protein
VLGQNFSGAAGNLQIYFGDTAATNVSVVDDSHVSAVVPAGSGTIDVRVQSGVTTASNPSNYKDPIFGYGISAVTAADRFTYSSHGNQPPTVATPASASPSTVAGTTTALSVLGSDDGGEGNLTYTWVATTLPSGATPSYSANGTNAAKNTTVTFNRAGGYTFQVTITDSGGLSVTSSTNVTVNQTLTSITITPASVTLTNGGTQQFTAPAYDQFAVSLATQPHFSWSLVSGMGLINSTGLYTAPRRGTGSAVVKGRSGSVFGTATVAVQARSNPASRRASRQLRLAGGQSIRRGDRDRARRHVLPSPIEID